MIDSNDVIALCIPCHVMRSSMIDYNDVIALCIPCHVMRSSMITMICIIYRSFELDITVYVYCLQYPHSTST